jgi:protein TonB
VARNDIEGTVYVQFVVDKDGKVGQVKVLRAVDKFLDKEAARVVNSMPAWKPGKQNGKAVAVYYTVPIRFQLQ